MSITISGVQVTTDYTRRGVANGSRRAPEQTKTPHRWGALVCVSFSATGNQAELVVGPGAVVWRGAACEDCELQQYCGHYIVGNGTGQLHIPSGRYMQAHQTQGTGLTRTELDSGS